MGCAQEKKLFSKGDEPKVFCLFRVNFPSTEQFETKIIELNEIFVIQMFSFSGNNC